MPQQWKCSFTGHFCAREHKHTLEAKPCAVSGEVNKFKYFVMTDVTQNGPSLSKLLPPHAGLLSRVVLQILTITKAQRKCHFNCCHHRPYFHQQAQFSLFNLYAAFSVCSFLKKNIWIFLQYLEYTYTKPSVIKNNTVSSVPCTETRGAAIATALCPCEGSC